MAAYFSDTETSFSRAVDEEEDDSNENDNVENSIPEERRQNMFVHRNKISVIRAERKACVRWSPLVRAEVLNQHENKLPCQNMIIAIGPAASGFVQAYILSEDFYVIGALFSGLTDEDFNTFNQNSPSDKTCYIYRSRSVPDMFMCLCKTNVDPEQAYSWTEQLFSNISTTQRDIYISILCTYMTSEYKSEIPTSDMHPPLLRALRTTRFPGTPLCPYLEQPNLVSGLPAQYSIYLDHASMKVFYPLLKSTPIKDVVRENPKADEELNHIVEQYTTRDSLYI